MIEIQDFVRDWNQLVNDVGDQYFTIRLDKTNENFTGIIDALIKQTNVSEIPIGGITFLPEFNLNDELAEFGCYDECSPIYLNNLREIQSQNPYSEEPGNLIKVAKDEASFVKSLSFYGRLYFNKVVRKINVTDQDAQTLVALVGGENYGDLYKYLCAQLK